MSIEAIVASIKNQEREERVPVSFKLSKTEYEALKAIALNHGTTVSKVLVSMVQTTLKG
jgi:hypothetical protein